MLHRVARASAAFFIDFADRDAARGTRRRRSSRFPAPHELRVGACAAVPAARAQTPLQCASRKSGEARLPRRVPSARSGSTTHRRRFEPRTDAAANQRLLAAHRQSSSESRFPPVPQTPATSGRVQRATSEGRVCVRAGSSGRARVHPRCPLALNPWNRCGRPPRTSAAFGLAMRPHETNALASSAPVRHGHRRGAAVTPVSGRDSALHVSQERD